MAIERLIIDRIHAACEDGDLNQEELAKTLLGELRFLQHQGLTDLPVEEVEKTFGEKPAEVEERIPSKRLAERYEEIESADWLGLSGEEGLGEAATALYEFIAIKSIEEPGRVVTFREMRSFMARIGYAGSRESIRTYASKIRGMLRERKGEGFDLASVPRKGYLFIRPEKEDKAQG
ncbi:MAG: hypothetical protein ABIB61_03180 [Candidatus Shapirobacteria bacterium]